MPTLERIFGFPVVESFSGRTLVYSNRPPTAGASGGAQEVIEAVSATWWIGPEAVSNESWNSMITDERSALTQKTDSSRDEKANYDVHTSPAPTALEKMQYETIANEILWPIAHSMKPTLAPDVCFEDIEDAYWNGYIRFNELGGNAVHKMVEEHNLTHQDRIWVHDYQCDNVPGLSYTRHIPFPTLEFLKSVEFKKHNGDKIPLLETPFFRDIIELSCGRALMTFQRADDQINYLMALAAVANKKGQVTIDSNHPDLQNLVDDIRDPEKIEKIRAALKKEITFVSACKIQAFGGKVILANLPVGQETARTHAIAQINEECLDKTQFKSGNNPREYKIFNAPLGNGEYANLTASDPEIFKDKRPLLKDLLKPIEGRDWVLSVHRNDYTKGTLTKLEAAEKLFEENSKLAETTTFLFVLQPTREDIPAYKEYAEKVFTKAQALRKKYGNKSVVIIPEAVKHDDILGLMRREEVKAFMGLGLKDGHDLTVREVIDANDLDRAIGVIVSEGIGASDVAGKGENGEDAAFVIKDPTDPHEVKEALKIILDPNNAEAIKARFNAMKERSTKYNARHFARGLNTLYPEALRYRFEDLDFSQPLGDYQGRDPLDISATRPQNANYAKEFLANQLNPIEDVITKARAAYHTAATAESIQESAQKYARTKGLSAPKTKQDAENLLWRQIVEAQKSDGPGMRSV